MTSKRMFAFAASICVLALPCAPNALAACGGLTVPLAHPTSWHPQYGPAHLRRGALGDDQSDGEDGAAIVGMWHVLFTSEGEDSALPAGTPVDDAIVAWHSDHTEIMNSARPPQDGSFCMGVWQQTGKYTYKLNHFARGNEYTPGTPDGVVGATAGPTHIVENVTLSSDGNQFSGTFTLDAYHTDHTVTHITGVITATRITVNTAVFDPL